MKNLHPHILRSLQPYLPMAGGLLVGSSLVLGGLILVGPSTKGPNQPPANTVTSAPADPAPTGAAQAQQREAVVVKEPTKTAPSIALDAEPGVDHLAEADQALGRSDAEGALEAYRRQLSRDPASVDTLLTIGRLARQADQLELSAQALEAAAHWDAQEPEIFLQLARTCLQQKAYAKARTAAETAVALRPQEAVGFNLLGRAHLNRSEWAPAERAFRRGLALEPDNAHLNNNYGLLMLYRKRGVDAADALETSIALFGDEVPAYVLNNLGLAYELLGELEAAKASFEDALLVDPHYVKAHVNVARIVAHLEKGPGLEASATARLEAAELEPEPAEPEPSSVSQEELLVQPGSLELSDFE